MKLFVIGLLLLGASYMVKGVRDRQMHEAVQLYQEAFAFDRPQSNVISDWLFGTADDKADAAYNWAIRYDQAMTALAWMGGACVVVGGVTGFIKMREQGRVLIALEGRRHVQEEDDRPARRAFIRMVESRQLDSQRRAQLPCYLREDGEREDEFER